MTTKIISAEDCNAPNKPSTSKGEYMRTYWTLTYEANGDTFVAEVLDTYTGEFRVIEHILANRSNQSMPGYCPHAFLNRVTECDGEVISDENIHIVTYFDFYCIDRSEMQDFIAALINYVTNIMFTPMSTKRDFNEFICENRP